MGVSEPLIQTGLLGEAVDRAPVAIFVADENMRYVAVNQTACDLLGYTREELLALTVTDVARYRSARKQYEEVVAGRLSEGEAVLTRKDESTVPIHAKISPATVAGMAVFVAVAWPNAES